MERHCLTPSSTDHSRFKANESAGAVLLSPARNPVVLSWLRQAASVCVTSAEAMARAGQYLGQATDICGHRLVACWLHGGSTFPDPSLVPGDVDVCVVVA